MWVVYVLKSTVSRRTYVGCTVDVKRRLRQHNGEIKGGARRTRTGRPWGIAVIYGPYINRSKAQSIEYAVKRLRGKARLAYATDISPDLDKKLAEFVQKIR